MREKVRYRIGAGCAGCDGTGKLSWWDSEVGDGRPTAVVVVVRACCDFALYLHATELGRQWHVQLWLWLMPHAL